MKLRIWFCRFCSEFEVDKTIILLLFSFHLPFILKKDPASLENGALNFVNFCQAQWNKSNFQQMFFSPSLPTHSTPNFSRHALHELYVKKHAHRRECSLCMQHYGCVWDERTQKAIKNTCVVLIPENCHHIKKFPTGFNWP